MPAAAPAIPPKPRTPAINAITTNVNTQRNIIIDFDYINTAIMSYTLLRIFCSILL